MNIAVDGVNIFVATGGCAFDPKKPTVVFVPVSYTHLTLPTILRV